MDHGESIGSVDEQQHESRLHGGSREGGKRVGGWGHACAYGMCMGDHAACACVNAWYHVVMGPDQGVRHEIRYVGGVGTRGRVGRGSGDGGMHVHTACAWPIMLHDSMFMHGVRLV